jgi:hypothetical protein
MTVDFGWAAAKEAPSIQITVKKPKRAVIFFICDRIRFLFIVPESP